MAALFEPFPIWLSEWETPTLAAVPLVAVSKTRVVHASAAAKALGITWKQQYLLMGEYDIMTIVEAPNDEVVAKFALMGMTGSLAITTMRAFTESEADKLIKELRPPD